MSDFARKSIDITTNCLAYAILNYSEDSLDHCIASMLIDAYGKLSCTVGALII